MCVCGFLFVLASLGEHINVICSINRTGFAIDRIKVRELNSMANKNEKKKKKKTSTRISKSFNRRLEVFFGEEIIHPYERGRERNREQKNASDCTFNLRAYHRSNRI